MVSKILLLFSVFLLTSAASGRAKRMSDDKDQQAFDEQWAKLTDTEKEWFSSLFADDENKEVKEDKITAILDDLSGAAKGTSEQSKGLFWFGRPSPWNYGPPSDEDDDDYPPYPPFPDYPPYPDFPDDIPPPYLQFGGGPPRPFGPYPNSPFYDEDDDED